MIYNPALAASIMGIRLVNTVQFNQAIVGLPVNRNAIAIKQPMNTHPLPSRFSLPGLARLAAMWFLCANPAGSFAAEATTKDVLRPTPPGTASEKKLPTALAASPSRKVLIFRNVRSWNRKRDFEEALTNSGFKFDVKPSAEMESADLKPYGVVIIPGAQWQDDFYHDYEENRAKFDTYVTNGGTLVLELNGAERDGINLPLGVTMARHGSKDNAILLAQHPVMLPFEGKPIHASYASHGFLEGVPKNALVLVAEMTGDAPDPARPTFVEYACGSGRVLAACQCFHDQDNSGRGVLMDSLISYAAEREWFAPKK